jgi:hypothetical protein
MNSYTLIRRNGTSVEVPFLMAGNVPYISEHIPAAEFGEHDAKGNWQRNIPIVVFEPVVETFEAVRTVVNEPIPVNSGYRSPEKQRLLYLMDLKENHGKPSGKVSSPGNSPHETGAAMDLGIPKGWTAAKLAAEIRKASQRLGYGFVRIGIKKYGGRFIHVDWTFLLYEPYVKGKKNPHPRDWAPGVSW